MDNVIALDSLYLQYDKSVENDRNFTPHHSNRLVRRRKMSTVRKKTFDYIFFLPDIVKDKENVANIEGIYKNDVKQIPNGAIISEDVLKCEKAHDIHRQSSIDFCRMCADGRQTRARAASSQKSLASFLMNEKRKRKKKRDGEPGRGSKDRKLLDWLQR